MYLMLFKLAALETDVVFFSQNASRVFHKLSNELQHVITIYRDDRTLINSQGPVKTVRKNTILTKSLLYKL